jgi:EAL domain-containing protein (putative c-di-GMP-specific phosphodiesterase class I)
MEQGKPLLASDSPLVDFDAICQKIRGAVEPARTHAVSLHDELGDVLWLSESSMGPDEHNAVREAAEAFAKPAASPILAFDLGDARSAIMVRAVNQRRAMVGVIMIIMDTRIVSHGLPKLMTPKLQRVLVEFSAMRPDRQPEPESVSIELVLPEPVTQSSRPNRQTAVPRPAAPAAPTRSAASPAAAPPRTMAPPRSAAAPTKSAETPPARTFAAPSPTSSASLPFSAGPRSISAQVQQIASRPAPRPAVSASSMNSARPAPAAPPMAATPPMPTAPSASPAPAATQAFGSRAPSPAPVPMPPPMPAEEAEKQPARNGVTPEIDRLHAALRKSPIALHVQRLIPLSKGSQLKRYEVLLRSGSEASPNAAPHAMLKAAVDNGLGSMIDRRVLSELISWLIRHPEVCQDDEVMFSVNLTNTALHDEHFIKFVELCLSKSSLPKATIAFEVDASTALNLAEKIGEVATALHRLGCPLILDDFALRTECFGLLRLPGVRYVKLAPEITAKMRTDKVSQAAITGVVQMARVLGMHTVAKRTETAAEQEWLTALGVDFVQSNAISPPVAIDSLAKPANFKI